MPRKTFPFFVRLLFCKQMQDMSQSIATPLCSVIQQISLVSVASLSFSSYYRVTLVAVVGHTESYSVIVVC